MAQGPLRIIDVKVDSPADDEILIRTAACGVCHSDLTIRSSATPGPLPLVLGHEASGVVEAVGSAVTAFSPGDHVVTCPAAFCGSCEWCIRGRPQFCLDKGRTRTAGAPPRLSTEGRPVAAFAGLGGFAEVLLVHERAAVRIPPEMPLDRAALLGCAVVTGMGAVLNTAEVRPGQTVAVIGCGGVGLNAVQAARFVGASRIIAVDRLASKLERAVQFGATDVVDAGAEDPVEAVVALTSGGVDHALEVVGRPATVEQAFAMLRTGGTATVVGVPRPDDRITISPMQLLMEKRLQGSQMGSTRFRVDVPLYAQLYLAGRIKLDELLTRSITLDEAGRALDQLDDFDGARSVIRFDA
jgi:S-(hydroxymethyl)glutathione dehydrogenase/alcohol dehydrogenase